MDDAVEYRSPLSPEVPDDPLDPEDPEVPEDPEDPIKPPFEKQAPKFPPILLTSPVEET